MKTIATCRYCGHWMVEGKNTCYVCGRNQNRIFNLVSATNLTAVATIVMAILTGVMCWTLVQNRELLKLTEDSLSQNEKSLSLTRKSIDLQEKEFKLRNRPVVIVTNPQLAGPSTDISWKVYPFSIYLDIENVSDIPATKVFAKSDIYVNGTKIGEGPKFDAGVIVKGRVEHSRLSLTEALYDAATNEQNRFEIQLKTTYSGVLGEKTDINMEVFYGFVTLQKKKALVT